MTEPLTPEKLANFRESIRLHGADKETVQLPFDTFVQFLDAAERATDLEQIAGDLLAVMHDDGGQYTTQHGLLKSAEDAIVRGNKLAAENERLRKVGAVLANIADAYDDNALDDEARKFWGQNDEHENQDPPSTIELYTGRGGRRLLTLQDCFNARAALAEGGVR